MGMFKKRVRVSNINDSTKFFEEDFWVDTGALYSLIPIRYLEQIDFEPERTKDVLLANGSIEKKLFGHCKLEVIGLDNNTFCPVIAGNADSLFLLGATALENFSVEVDLIAKDLKPMLAIMA